MLTNDAHMKLSMVTTCFNAEKCIERTIISVLNQEQPVYEYIIVDGGSKDGTMEIVKQYTKAFEKKGVVYKYKSEPDKGISDGFNKGIAQATGDFIGLINADDELLPNASKILSMAYEKKPADVLYGNCIWVDIERGIEYISKPKGKPEELLYKMTLIHPSTFVKKIAYDQCGGFNVNYLYSMDKELLYRLYKAGMKFSYIDEPLTKFKSGGVSDTHTWEVYKEGIQMAIDNGSGRVKAYSVQLPRYIKSRIAQILKNTPIYGWIKKGKTINEN